MLPLLVTACATDREPRQTAIPTRDVVVPEETLPPAPESDPFAEGPITVAPVDNAIRVGFLAPLSGRHEAIGHALLNAAQLALFDLADDRFRLLVGDTGGTPEGARLAAQDLLDQGAQLLVGPLFAESVRAVGEEVLYRNVSVIGFSNDRSVAAPGIYVMGLSPEEQIDRIVAHASSQGLTRIATLVPDNPFGQRALDALRDAAFNYGGELAAFALYDPAADNITPQVIQVADYDRRHRELLEERKKLKRQGGRAAEAALLRLENLDTLTPPEYDALLLPFGGRHLLTLASLFAFYDVDPVDVRYLGTNVWDDTSLTREPTLQGGWFPGPPPGAWQAFSQRYNQAYGEEPPRIASLGYDATALAAALGRQADEIGAGETGAANERALPSSESRNENSAPSSAGRSVTPRDEDPLSGLPGETYTADRVGPPAETDPFAKPGSAYSRFTQPSVFSEDKITNPNGYAGIDGIFRFLPDGRVERVYSIFEVTSTGFKEIDKARTTFEDVVF